MRRADAPLRSGFGLSGAVPEGSQKSVRSARGWDVAHSKLLTNEYFTNKSLFLKDLAKNISKSLIPQDRPKGGRTACVRVHRSPSYRASRRNVLLSRVPAIVAVIRLKDLVPSALA